MCGKYNMNDVKRLHGEAFFRYQMRKGWCAFMDNSMTVEGQGATLAIGLGVWLLYADMFRSCPSVYWVMESVLPEIVWGILFITVGVIQIISLFFNHFTLRKYVLLAKIVLWVFILCTVLYGDWRAPGVPIYTILAVSAVRGFFCLQKSAQLTRQ